MYLDNSLEEVSEQLVVMYHECLQGDFTSVEIILEANLRAARQLIRPNVVKANSSGMDASPMFRQGIGLLMENLWVRRIFIHDLCHSNPYPMLQQLADEILFWFTQTIKPLSFAYLERILRNELYSLPLDYQVATSGITKEVATKLMLMHKECLQGNFSSVEILKEESLNQDKGMSERIGVAPPAAAVPVVSEKSGVEDGDMRVDYGYRGDREREAREKIRVERQKERERERRLEAKDAAMGKNSKITRDSDRALSEELDLGLAGTKVMYDERLFNQDKAMSSGMSKVQKEMFLKEKERMEQELRALAQKARSERIGVAPPAAAVPVVSENMRVNRRKEKETERRLEAKDDAMGKKSKNTRDRDRDISEELDLGLASTKQGTNVMYDARLFNQDKAMSSRMSINIFYQ